MTSQGHRPRPLQRGRDLRGRGPHPGGHPHQVPRPKVQRVLPVEEAVSGREESFVGARARTVPYEGDNFANYKVDNFSLIND